jgi:hypothetical protein
MATEISGIGPATQAASAISPIGSQRPEGAEPSRGSPPAYAASVAGVPYGHAYGYHAKRELASAMAEQAQRLDAASDLGEADAQVAQVDVALAGMQTALEGIVKRYPPYGNGAPERIDLINQVTGLRKQLEALTFPPEAAEAEALVKALPTVGQEDQKLQQVPDEELAALLDKVVAAREEIAIVRESMWADIVTGPDEEQAAIELAGETGAQIAEAGQAISDSPEVLSDVSV